MELNIMKIIYGMIDLPFQGDDALPRIMGVAHKTQGFAWAELNRAFSPERQYTMTHEE